MFLLVEVADDEAKYVRELLEDDVEGVKRVTEAYQMNVTAYGQPTYALEVAEAHSEETGQCSTTVDGQDV